MEILCENVKSKIYFYMHHMAMIVVLGEYMHRLNQELYTDILKVSTKFKIKNTVIDNNFLGSIKTNYKYVAKYDYYRIYYNHSIHNHRRYPFYWRVKYI